MTEIKRAVEWLKSWVSVPETAAASDATSSLDFDPAWHGDHWQNLLSSPMDARHYVMEDWQVPLQHEFAAEPVDETAEKKAA
ncbi:hypothetical protein AWB67_01039 [Caballeronia terrestris]|uniref:Uncharacterized protein n=1 Tax=Caballeronia terrestris TaxID=1226301 RepID=A0A158G195_9BURK|nr:hypothetical protein [Caballeronia terrestris]SAL25898.1 hypothetical protein AWB67_01039 [Caballeronia terrestris]